MVLKSIFVTSTPQWISHVFLSTLNSGSCYKSFSKWELWRVNRAIDAIPLLSLSRGNTPNSSLANKIFSLCVLLIAEIPHLTRSLPNSEFDFLKHLKTRIQELSSPSQPSSNHHQSRGTDCSPLRLVLGMRFTYSGVYFPVRPTTLGVGRSNVEVAQPQTRHRVKIIIFFDPGFPLSLSASLMFICLYASSKSIKTPWTILDYLCSVRYTTPRSSYRPA